MLQFKFPQIRHGHGTKWCQGLSQQAALDDQPLSVFATY